MPFLLVGALVTGAAALISTIAGYAYSKQVEAASEGLTPPLPPSGTIPAPQAIYYPSGSYSVPGGIDTVITSSQIAAQQQLSHSLDLKGVPTGNDQDYTPLWIAGLGIVLVLGLRK